MIAGWRVNGLKVTAGYRCPTVTMISTQQGMNL